MATGRKSFVRTVDKASEEFYDFVCSPCSKDGINIEAKKYCDDGCNYVCKKCVRDHNKFPSLANHKILDIAAMSGRGPRAAKFVPTERCASHHGSLIDTYCGDHDDVCCPTCVSISHRACTDIDYLPLVAKGIKTTKEYQNIKDDLMRVKSHLESLKKSKQDDQSRLDKEKNTCITQIKDFRRKINEYLDDIEKVAIVEVCSKHNEYNKKLKTDITSLEQMVSMLETSFNQLEKANKDNEPQVFVCVKMCKRNQNDGNKLAQQMQDCHRQEKLNFQINKDIENYISNLTSLGDFPQEAQNDGPNSMAASKLKTQGDRRYTVSLLGKYDVRVRGERKSRIFGSCQLNDETILLTDVNNNKIKRLNSSYKVIDHIELPGEPWSVCAAGSEAAVALYQGQIQFVSLVGKMSLTRSFDVEGYCVSVAYSDGELFIGVKLRDVGTYSIYSTSTCCAAGQLLYTIQNDEAGQISKPYGITVSADGKLIHVADSDLGIVTLDREGKVQSKISDPDLQYARGICLGDNDQLYVSGSMSNNIIQFGKSEQKLAVLLDATDGVKQPMSVCYDPVNNRLIVTMDHATTIAVYNLTET